MKLAPVRLLRILAVAIIPLTIVAQEFNADVLDVYEYESGLRGILPTVTREMGDRGGKFRGEAPAPELTRRYYVAAELEPWDYLPSGKDEVCGKPVPPQLEAKRTTLKIRYFEYTDATFSTRKTPDPRVGIMGPVLRGVTGQFLAVTFLNRTEFSLSMHPHGVSYDKDSEGAHYQPNPGLGAAVGAGAKFTYVWKLDEQSGPLPTEPSSKGWLYHSHVMGDEEANLGLVGCIIVTDPKRARPDGTPADVDRETASLFMIFNESGVSHEELELAALEAGPKAPPPGLAWANAMSQSELGSRYAINGLVFGGLRGLDFNEGERVRWYLFGLGDEIDLHTAHWHGLRVVEDGRRRTDVVELLPASMKIADMVADNPGEWLYHCHVSEHMREGMYARMTVHAKGRPGVSREPSEAFLGLPERGNPLNISEAVLTSDGLRLRGSVNVFDAFAVSKMPLSLEIGNTVFTATPDTRGSARAGNGLLVVTNVSEYGVVYGGKLEFEAVLKGPAWKGELERQGLSGNAKTTEGQEFQLRFKLGESGGSAGFRLTPRSPERLN